MTDLAVVKIFRFDPSVNGEAHFETYRDILYRDRTVLEVLRHIYEELDATLAFRAPCEVNCCKGCLMQVNGRPALACERNAEAEMTIEPLQKFEIIKDLVVDFGRAKRTKK